MNPSDLSPHALLEPTPIALDSMKVVDQISLEDEKSFVRKYPPGLLSLLRSAGQPMHVPSVSAASSICPVPSSASIESQLSANIQKQRKRETSYKSHSEKWNLKFRDLLQFRRRFSHCHVPLDWPQNPSLPHWIKHQRYQYKAKLEGKRSTMTPARQKALDDLGFVWDAHRATWEERYNELVIFREVHGHCNVPCRFETNPKLSTWMKCQRRQYKLRVQGGKSHMTPERMGKLSRIGFVWSPRLQTSKSAILAIKTSDDMFNI